MLGLVVGSDAVANGFAYLGLDGGIGGDVNGEMIFVNAIDENVTIYPGSYTDSTGTISFDDDNLTTTGTGTFGDIISGTATLSSDLTLSGSTSNLYVEGFADIDGSLDVDTGTLYVDSTNNRVGIGTTAPASQLEISGLTANSGFIGTKVTETGLDGKIMFGIYKSPAGDWDLMGLWANTDTPTAANLGFAVATTGDTYFNTVAGHEIYFQVGNANKMTILSNGNIGIGDGYPDAKLDVEGDCIITSDLTIGGATHFNSVAYNWPASDGTAAQVLHTDAAGGVYWDTDDSVAGGEWTDTGAILHPNEQDADSVAIGAVNQAGADIFLGVTGQGIFNQQKNDVDFLISGNNETNLFYGDAGNDRIGIGTNTPSAVLDVVGDVTVSSDLTVSGATAALYLPNYTFPNAVGADNEILKIDGTTLGWEADAGAGGAAEVSVMLKPQSAKLPTSNPAVIDAGNSGWRLLFDDTTQETAVWEFILDDDYGSGTLYADVYFSMASGEADEVQFEVYVMAVTATTDDADWDTDSYDTENVGVTTVAATAGRPYKQTITLTNDDSLAAGDMIRIKVSTDSDDATNDDATGDRELRMVIIRE